MFLAFAIVDAQNVNSFSSSLEIGCGYMHEQTNMIENKIKTYKNLFLST